MVQPWRTGKVIRIEDETATTKRFWIQVPELESFDFKPGQFVTIDLPIHEKANKRWRSYSIASWPNGTNIFELVIVLLEGGAGTTYLFNEVNIGSELIYRGAQGVFTLPEIIDRDLYFICTGTGIAPFRSMANYIVLNKVPHQNIHLIFGCRMMCDGLYAQEMKQLEKTHPNFKFHPTFSREDENNATIRRGYVHTIYEEIVKEHLETNAEGATVPAPAYFYLCGWKNMIDEAKQRVLALGYDKKAIHLELYG
ncbi:MAG: FAD-dependent oxidoreductase [Flavitalea sp.]